MNAPESALTEKYLRLSLDQLQESKTNPRRHFDKAADAELAASIKAQGVIEPVIVRPHPTGKGYELVAGARRLRQSKVAGAADIPAIVRHYTDAQSMEVQIIENLQRKDVHPYDEAFGFKALLDTRENGKPRYDVPAIAAKIGKSVSYVYMRLKLTDLVKDAQEAFLADKITAGHAEKIARLQPKQQAEALKECTSRYSPLTVRDLQDWVERNVHLDLAKAPFDPKDTALIPSAKACTTCPKRAGTQPDLFADIDKADTCTDPGCFKAKVNAHFEQRKSALKKDGLKIVEATSNHYSNNKNVTPLYKLTRAGNIKCEHLGAALIVDGNDRGDDVRICTEPKCKKHHPPAPKTRPGVTRRSHSSDSSTSSASRTGEQKRTAENMAQAKAVMAVLSGFRKKPAFTLQDLQQLAHGMVWNVDATEEEFAVLCQWHGLKPGKGHQANTAAVEQAIKNCKSLPRATELLFGLLVLDVFNQRYGDFLLTKQALAKRYGVNLTQLETKLLAEIKAKDKALAAAAKRAKADAKNPDAQQEQALERAAHKKKLQTSAKTTKKASASKGKKRG